MTILQQPDSLSLSLNLKDFHISTSEPVSLVLKQNEETILSQRYDPSAAGRIVISLRDIVHARLSYQLREATQTYEQTGLVSLFTAVFGNTEVPFRVVRAGVDRLSDTAGGFLKQNFLTWQPTVKGVTYYSPEFLTYYAVDACVAKLRAYFTDTTGSVSSQAEVTIKEMQSGKAYTIPLQYAIVVSHLADRKPAYYDVWVETSDGNRLTYVQRYYADNMRSEQEQWILFENSLGGLDTFRAYGTAAFEGEHTHNIAEVNEISSEYRVDTQRKFQKNTGHLNNEERKWLLDFFPSQSKYIYLGSYLRKIVVIESSVNFSERDLPSNYSFTFKYADARPLLNLPRAEVPADMLSLNVPDVGSFTVPPRLAEFPRLPLSEGVLFPVQNPYSEKWGIASAGALADYIGQLLSSIAGSGGGVGHSHHNIDLLNLLSFAREYLLIDGKKAKAGYADIAGDVEGDKYLRKDLPDSASEQITFLKGLQFGEFAPGLSGYGGKIGGSGNAELESLVVRSFIESSELRYNRVKIIHGEEWNAKGGGIIESVDPAAKSFKLKLEPGEYPSVAFDDLCKAKYNTGTGYRTAFFRIVSVSPDGTVNYELRPGYDVHPQPTMHFVAFGNRTDKTRQASAYSTTSYTRYLSGVNDWDIRSENIAMQFGDLSNLSVYGLQLEGYSAYLSNVYFTGLIVQLQGIVREEIGRQLPGEVQKQIPVLWDLPVFNLIAGAPLDVNTNELLSGRGDGSIDVEVRFFRNGDDVTATMRRSSLRLFELRRVHPLGHDDNGIPDAQWNEANKGKDVFRLTPGDVMYSCGLEVSFDDAVLESEFQKLK